MPFLTLLWKAIKAFWQTLTQSKTYNNNSLQQNNPIILKNSNNNIINYNINIIVSPELEQMKQDSVQDIPTENTNLDKKNKNETKEFSLHLYDEFSTLPKILLIHNSNLTGILCDISFPYYDDNQLCSLCENLYKETKLFDNKYAKSKYRYYKLIFKSTWIKIYQYYLLNNKITEFKKTRIELESIEEKLNDLKLYIKFNFNDTDYILAHNNFVNDNLQFVLDNYSYNSKIIAQWLINNRSLIKYIPNVYLHIYNIPENIIDSPFLHIRNYYNSYYYELLQIYLSNNDINNYTSYKQLLSDNINKLFNAIKQHTTSDKYTDEERKYINSYYEKTNQLQKVLDAIGITCNNEIAKAS